MKSIKFNIITAFIFSFSLFNFHAVGAQELQILIDEALTNNPKIKKFELQYRIASEKVNEVNTLPNTEFGVGFFASEPETRIGAQRFKVSVKQVLPWFGNITAREKYVSSLAASKYEDITIVKRKLVASVLQSYYNLVTNTAKQVVLNNKIQLLKTYETLALTSVEVGKSSVVVVLRLQMRTNEMQQLKRILEQQYLSEQTNFNKLLNRDKNITITVLDAMDIPSIDFETNSEKLIFHPELLKYDKLYQSITQSEVLNQKESNPMIGFGFDYVNVAKRPDMNFGDNGKDIVMPMLTVSIPIFNNSRASKTKQNNLQQEELLAQKQERLNALKVLLDTAINNRTSARIRYETQAKNLKQAKYAEEILVKNYETVTIDFKDLLEIQELQLKFEMNIIESVNSYYAQTTIINYLMQ
jgi:cobalt-zinc-cadmium efflux system outer membrane protein